MRKGHLATRIIWLCHAPTRAMREAAFPDPRDGLDDPGRRKASEIDPGSVRHDIAVASPAAAAQETASALGIDAVAEPGIRDVEHGQWAGRSIGDVHATEPELLAAWLADPTQATPGGETLASVAERVGGWIDSQRDANARILAITHPAVIRVAIAHVLGCPLSSCRHIDIAPLSRTTISFNGQWRLQELRLPG